MKSPERKIDWLVLAGVGLTLHFVFVCAAKILSERPDQVWWVSHISLAIAAVGLIFRSRLLVATALTNVLVLHLLWLIDFTCWRLSGRFAFAMTSYLNTDDWCVWLTTTHHFYLAPLLLFVFLRDRSYPRESWLLSATVFVFLSIISRGFLMPVENINYAFFVPEPLEAWGLGFLNRVPASYYLVILNLCVNALAFFPASVLLFGIAKRFEQARELSQTKLAEHRSPA
jgi:hypothetical protein